MDSRTKSNIQKILFIIILLASYFLIQLNFLGDWWFETDELDIMELGKGIARGKLLYRDLASQHMPLSYYISALFYKLGAVTVTQQRLAFYGFFSICWVCISLFYKKYINRKVLILYPFIHCCAIQNVGNGTQILSEHLAGIGAIVLLLEFLIFAKRNELGLASCIRISIAILLMFGTIFVAIFPVFYIGLGVLGKEVYWKKENKKLNNKEWFLQSLRRYIKLFIIIALPWFILLGYYVYKNTFRLFIKSAYVLNREIYPKYLGFGDNILDTLLIAPFRNFSTFVVNFFNSISTGLTYTSILEMLLIGGGIVYIVKVIKEESTFLGVVIAMYVLSLHVRGCFDFHSTAGTEILAFMMAYMLMKGVEDIGRSGTDKNWSAGMMAMLLFFITSGYLSGVNVTSEINSVKTASQETTDSRILKAITEESEGIWNATFANGDLMRADRIGVGGAAAVPWMWEGVGKIQFEELKNEKPRVVLMREDHEVWGHKIVDYAPKVVKYIKKHYRQIPGSEWIYVRKDYYKEACGQVKELE